MWSAHHFLGYHEKPGVDLGAILPIRFTNTQTFPPIVYKPDVEDVKQVRLGRSALVLAAVAFG